MLGGSRSNAPPLNAAGPCRCDQEQSCPAPAAARHGPLLQPRRSAVLGSQGPFTAQSPRAGPTGGLRDGRPRAQREQGKSWDPRSRSAPQRPSGCQARPDGDQQPAGAAAHPPFCAGLTGASSERLPPFRGQRRHPPPRGKGPAWPRPPRGWSWARPRPPPRPAQVSGETGWECGWSGGGRSAVRWLHAVGCAWCCCSVCCCCELPPLLKVSGAA